MQTIIAILTFLTGVFFYGRSSGRNSEKTKADSVLLDDIITTKKIDHDVANLGNDEVSNRLRKFSRRSEK